MNFRLLLENFQSFWIYAAKDESVIKAQEGNHCWYPSWRVVVLQTIRFIHSMSVFQRSVQSSARVSSQARICFTAEHDYGAGVWCREEREREREGKSNHARDDGDVERPREKKERDREIERNREDDWAPDDSPVGAVVQREFLTLLHSDFPLGNRESSSPLSALDRLTNELLIYLSLHQFTSKCFACRPTSSHDSSDNTERKFSTFMSENNQILLNKIVRENQGIEVDRNVEIFY